MELRHLHYFLTIAREGSIGGAAKRLGLAPSTLYRRMADLDAELGVALFERSGGGVRLSNAGELFIDHARLVVEEAAAASENLRSLAKGRRGTVRIGLNGVGAQLPVVSQALRQSRLLLPELDLKLIFANSEEQNLQVEQGALDLGFVYTRVEPELGLAHAPLQRQRFVLAMPRGHPLAARRSVRLAELADEAFVFQARVFGGSVHDRLIAACSAGGLVPKIKHEFVDEDTQMALVATGAGVTLALEGAATRRWREALEFRPIEDLDVAITLDLIWRRETVSADVARVIEVIRKTAAEGQRLDLKPALHA